MRETFSSQTFEILSARVGRAKLIAHEVRVGYEGTFRCNASDDIAPLDRRLGAARLLSVSHRVGLFLGCVEE